jgi:urocanate hydratase
MAGQRCASSWEQATNRRSWARNKGAIFTLKREMERTPGLEVTVPYIADDKIIEDALNV